MNLTSKDQAAYSRLVGRLKKVLDAGPVMDGSLSTVNLGTTVRYQLTRKEEGRTKTVYVPRLAAETVVEWTNRWKEVRTLLRELGEFTRAILPSMVMPPVAKKAKPVKVNKPVKPQPKAPVVKKPAVKKPEPKTVRKPAKAPVKKVLAKKSVQAAAAPKRRAQKKGTHR